MYHLLALVLELSFSHNSLIWTDRILNCACWCAATRSYSSKFNAITICNSGENVKLSLHIIKLMNTSFQHSDAILNYVFCGFLFIPYERCDHIGLLRMSVGVWVILVLRLVGSNSTVFFVGLRVWRVWWAVTHLGDGNVDIFL